MIELRITVATAAELMAELCTLLEPDPQGDQIQYVVSLADAAVAEQARFNAAAEQMTETELPARQAPYRAAEDAKPKRKRRTNAEIAADAAPVPVPVPEQDAPAPAPVPEQDAPAPVPVPVPEQDAPAPEQEALDVDGVRARFARFASEDYTAAFAALQELGCRTFADVVKGDLLPELNDRVPAYPA